MKILSTSFDRGAILLSNGYQQLDKKSERIGVESV